MADSSQHIVRHWLGTLEGYNKIKAANLIDPWIRYTVKIAVDDSVIVWKDQSCVLTIPPFHFWDKFLRSLDYLDRNNIMDEEKRRKESMTFPAN